MGVEGADGNNVGQVFDVRRIGASLTATEEVGTLDSSMKPRASWDSGRNEWTISSAVQEFRFAGEQSVTGAGDTLAGAYQAFTEECRDLGVQHFDSLK